MGKISVTGRATIKVPHNLMILSMDVKARGHDLRELNADTEHQSEAFLAALEEIGIPPTAVYAQGTSITKQWAPDNTEVLEQARSFLLELPLNLALMNRISDAFTRTVSQGSFNPRFEVKEDVEIRDSLIRRAIADATQQADLIAGQLGQPLEGAIDVKVGSSDLGAMTINNPLYLRDVGASAKGASSMSDMSDQTSPSETLFTQEVKVVWRLGEPSDKA